MAEQHCTQRLDSWLKLVHHSKSSILTFCVSHFTFSLVATLGNLLVIRALIKASTIPANVKKLFLSLAFSELAVGLLLQLMRALWRQGETTFKRVFLFWLSSHRCIFPQCYCHCRRQASCCFTPFVISGACHTQTCYNSVVCMDNKLRP